jgi:hypothetical protein
MKIIHFTHGVTDPLTSFGAIGANFLLLADGQGDVHISCLHLESKSSVAAPSITHAAAVLVFHGEVIIESDGVRIDFSAGMGAIFDPNEPYTLNPNPAPSFLSSTLRTPAASRPLKGLQDRPGREKGFRRRSRLAAPLRPRVAGARSRRDFDSPQDY